MNSLVYLSCRQVLNFARVKDKLGFRTKSYQRYICVIFSADRFQSCSEASQSSKLYKLVWLFCASGLRVHLSDWTSKPHHHEKNLYSLSMVYPWYDLVFSFLVDYPYEQREVCCARVTVPPIWCWRARNGHFRSSCTCSWNHSSRLVYCNLFKT